MTKKTKVAFFADVLTKGLDGVTHTIYNIFERIPRERFEFLIITSVPPEEPLPWKTIQVKRLNIPFNSSYSMGLPYLDCFLKSELDRFNPDVMHFSSPSLLGKYALEYGKKNNIPVFSIYHTHFISYMDFYFHHIPFMIPVSKSMVSHMMQTMYNSCEKLYVPTPSIYDELLDIGIKKEKMSVWGRGMDTSMFSPSKRSMEFLSKYGDPSKKTVLFVSRIVWEKDIETLSLIYKKLQKERPDIQLMITGDGPQLGSLKKMLPEVIFTGKLIKDELAKAYASADVFVFPSPTETFGNVVLESLASGVPAVVAAKGGPKGIVRHGETGYHAEPKNINDFYEKIIRLVDDDDLRSYMGKNGRKYASTQSWKKLTAKLFADYEAINISETVEI